MRRQTAAQLVNNAKRAGRIANRAEARRRTGLVFVTPTEKTLVAQPSRMQSLLPFIRKASQKVQAKYGSQEQHRSWLAEHLISMYGLRNGQVVLPEPDTNFTMVYVPKQAYALEATFGLLPGSTTRFVLPSSGIVSSIVGMFTKTAGSFVSAMPNPFRPFQLNPITPHVQTTCRDTTKETSREFELRCRSQSPSILGMTLNVLTRSLRHEYLKATVADILEAYKRPTYVGLQLARADLPHGIAVRAALLEMITTAPNRDEWLASLYPLAEVLVCGFQNDAVSYADMLVALYGMYAVIYTHADSIAVMTFLVTMLYVRLPFMTRMRALLDIARPQFF